MKHPGVAFVIKYFDLVDEFIKVRCCSEELLQELHASSITNKSSYRSRVVRSCVPSFDSEVLAAVRRLDEGYDLEIVEELLYQICIDVNPSLEIHQVSIPSGAAEADKNLHEDPFLPRPGNEGARQSLFRRVTNLERNLRQQIIGQDDAISSLVRAVKKAAVGLKRPTHPVGTFLLVGRTGTGKTELAKAVARNLFDDPGADLHVAGLLSWRRASTECQSQHQDRNIRRNSLKHESLHWVLAQRLLPVKRRLHRRKPWPSPDSLAESESARPSRNTGFARIPKTLRATHAALYVSLRLFFRVNRVTARELR